MNILIGIGNTLHGDDGIGPYIAQQFTHQDWRSLDCGTAPENFTGVVRRENPDLVVVVDAADMGLPPGEFRIIPPSRLVDVSFSTHGPSLVSFIHYITPLANRIFIIGIQPGHICDEHILTSQIRASASKLIAMMQAGNIDQIPVLEN